MIRVGVTGGIGSGKSTLCRIWETLGAEVVYSDDLAKDLMERDPDLVGKIKREFGSRAYREDGTLNRAYLASEAFQQGKVDTLNRLVHPVVRKKIKVMMNTAERNGFSVFVQEAALLLNDGRPPGFDYIVLVTAPEQERVDRVKNRDSVSVDDVQLRIRRQIDFTELKPLCDFIIENDSSLANFEEKVRHLYYKLTEPGH